MDTTLEITNDAGVPFIVEISTDKGNVRFLDKRYPMRGERGQFVSSYHLSTILEHPRSTGLDLHTPVPAWKINSENMETIQRYIVKTLHMTYWDMPTLFERCSSASAWLAQRYIVDFDTESNVIIVDVAARHSTRYDTVDVREALSRLFDSMED